MDLQIQVAAVHDRVTMVVEDSQATGKKAGTPPLIADLFGHLRAAQLRSRSSADPSSSRQLAVRPEFFSGNHSLVGWEVVYPSSASLPRVIQGTLCPIRTWVWLVDPWEAPRSLRPQTVRCKVNQSPKFGLFEPKRRIPPRQMLSKSRRSGLGDEGRRGRRKMRKKSAPTPFLAQKSVQRKRTGLGLSDGRAFRGIRSAVERELARFEHDTRDKFTCGDITWLVGPAALINIQRVLRPFKRGVHGGRHERGRAAQERLRDELGPMNASRRGAVKAQSARSGAETRAP
ncbi:hypothetical protein FB451DRAFT_1176809 [Mycena latifolia]|nr:hypothetical protein FB451DRAFT_1176809 [Mycena latifolia]